MISHIPVGEGVHIASDGRKSWQIPRSMLRDITKYQAAKAQAAEQEMELLIIPYGDEAAGLN